MAGGIRIAVAIGAILLGLLWLRDGAELLRGGSGPASPDRVERAFRGLGRGDDPERAAQYEAMARGLGRATRTWRSVVLPLGVAKAALGALLCAGAIGLALRRPRGRLGLVVACLAGLLVTIADVVLVRQLALQTPAAIIEEAASLAGVSVRRAVGHYCAPEGGLALLGTTVLALPAFLFFALSLAWLCSPAGEASVGLNRPFVRHGELQEADGAALVARSGRWAAAALVFAALVPPLLGARTYANALERLHGRALLSREAGQYGLWNTLLTLAGYGVCLLVAVLAVRALRLSRAGMGASLRAGRQRLLAAAALLLALGMTAWHLSRGC